MSGRAPGSVAGIPVGRLRPYIRSRRDYLVFVTRRLWPIAVGITGLAVGVATLVSSKWAIGLSAVALTIGLGLFLKDAADAHVESSRFSCGYIVELFPVRRIKDPLGYEGAAYLAIPQRGTMLVHADADQMLQHSPIRVEIDATSYSLPEDLRRVAPLAIRTLRYGKVIYNGRVIGMVDDLLPATSGGTYTTQLRETGYFMGICSSELCQYMLIDQVTGQETEVRLEHLLEPSGHLVTLASSGMANIVGISTLAFTTDDVLLMVWQSARNTASPKLLAPSGSGSLEPRDLEAAGPSASLQDILRHGMEREFSEETGVSTDHVIDTRVIGFGRWLERGAKPEFFGVTRLSISSQHPSIARIKPAEAVFSEGVAKAFVDIQGLKRELSREHSVENAASCPTLLRASGSLPLLVGLRAAALYSGEFQVDERARNQTVREHG